MFIKHRYNHLVILILIIIIGFGFALTLPQLANIQSSAAEKKPEEPPKVEELVHNAESIYDFARQVESNSPNFQDLCYATHNNGTDVFSSLNASAVQDAVDIASTGSTVKVAGICIGVETRESLTQTVYISKSLQIEGGHTESDWTMKPDPYYYPTILHAGYDGRVAVISGTIDVTLDNLYLIGGMANSNGTIQKFGGAIYSNGSLTLTNSTIYSNTAQIGGGMFNDENSSLVISNVTFLDNQAETNGGGLLTMNISPTLNKVDFTGNRAGNHGGGIYAYNGYLIMNISNIAGNKAKNGGGLYNQNNKTIMTNLTFINNSAEFSGGGLYNDGNQSVMTNTLFSGNKAKNGGAINNFRHNSTLINSTLSGNYATQDGGGMSVGVGDSSVYNSIFWNNQDGSGSGTISATIDLDPISQISLTNSIVEASGGSDSWALDPTKYVNGGFNKDTDPLFVTPVDPATAPTADGDLRLTSNSPAKDMGNNGFINVPFDLDGNQRVVDGDSDGTPTVDMGAYEFQIPYIYDINLPVILN